MSTRLTRTLTALALALVLAIPAAAAAPAESGPSWSLADWISVAWSWLTGRAAAHVEPEAIRESSGPDWDPGIGLMTSSCAAGAADCTDSGIGADPNG